MNQLTNGNCEKCGKFKPESGKAYWYAGPICNCIDFNHVMPVIVGTPIYIEEILNRLEKIEKALNLK